MHDLSHDRLMVAGHHEGISFCSYKRSLQPDILGISDLLLGLLTEYGRSIATFVVGPLKK